MSQVRFHKPRNNDIGLEFNKSLAFLATLTTLRRMSHMAISDFGSSRWSRVLSDTIWSVWPEAEKLVTLSAGHSHHTICDRFRVPSPQRVCTLHSPLAWLICLPLARSWPLPCCSSLVYPSASVVGRTTYILVHVHKVLRLCRRFLDIAHQSHYLRDLQSAS